MLKELLLFLHVLISVVLIILILTQQGRHSDMGTAFGTGASQTVFGSQGSGSFLLKLIACLGLLFFITSLSLDFLTVHEKKQNFSNTAKSSLQQKPPAEKQSSVIFPNAGVPLRNNSVQSPISPG